MLTALAGTSEAQRGRVIRPHGGVRGSVVVVGGGYWGPWGYGSPYWGWGWGWNPYWWGPWGPYPGYYRFDERTASVRLEVTPKDTQVYLDGYYQGIVDDFDGVFQRLKSRPGEHEVVLYLKGYKTVRQSLALKRGEDYKTKLAMTPLAAGEANEPPPQPPAKPAAEAAPDRPGGRERPRDMEPPRDYQPPARRAHPGGEPTIQAQAYGALVIRVQPGGADVLVDGERWQGPDGQDRLVIQVPEGAHKIEIRKEGFSTFTSEISVRRGETVPVNVSLAKEPA